jgi:hypothetical protein
MLLYVSYTTFVVFENIDHKKVVYENISHFLMAYERFAVNYILKLTTVV